MDISRASDVVVDTDELFRSEAVEHHASSLRREGQVLRLYPAWVGGAFGVLLTAVAAAGVVVVAVPIRQYAGGPAFIRAEGRTVMTAERSGTVTAVDIEPGKQVASGDVLVRLDDSRERAALASNVWEVERQTRNLLLDLSDENARRALTTLRAEQRFLQSELEARCLRAEQNGVINDVRVRVGQSLSPGEIVATLSDPRSGFSVVALLPGSSRPQIKPGGPLRLELTGYRYAYQRLRIETVRDEIIGPVEARRYLGSDVADALPLTGPVVLVRARLPGETFLAEERHYHLFDGMLGVAEAAVRSERILYLLVPALKSLMGATDE